MKQQNKNFILNVTYQLLTYVFPLLTVPYTSRVLGVDNIGVYSYTYSIVYMFMLAAMLGIGNYGNREIARVRDNPDELSQVFTSIYALQVMMGTAATLIYAVYGLRFCKLYPGITQLQSIFLLSACIDVNWFYFGLEKFKMTITRNLIIKISSLLLIFLIVKNENDLWKYTLIMAGATFISQLYLFVNLPHYVKIVKVSLKEIFSHFHSVLILFIPILAFGIYRVMDKTMLGSLSSVTELGYYENAERLINIPISVINALGTVMLPYMAYMAKNGKGKLNSIISESMNTALVLATMMAGGLILIANDAAIVIFGREFEKSSGIIIVLSITIIASAWANVIRTQYLIPNRQDGIYIRSTIWGAVANFICNVIFIKQYGAYGACIGTILAEYFIMLYQSFAIGNKLPQREFVKQLIQAGIKTAIIVVLGYLFTFSIANQSVRLVAKIVIAMALFVLINHTFIRSFLGAREGNKKNADNTI